MHELRFPSLKRVSFSFCRRYMMQWPGGRILQRHELDAFLAQAVSSQLYEPDQLQELKVTPHFITDLFMFAFDLTSSKKSCNIHTHTLLMCSELSSCLRCWKICWYLCIHQVEKVDARGVQLASLFMAGVDTALFINDVCGQPLPWEHCCPWGFFDGKLFQSKLARAARDRAALLDMCEGQVKTGVHVYMYK